MIRKVLGMVALAGVGALIASQWRDLVRYTKIREITRTGNPGLVPVRGRASYPTDRGAEPAAAGDDFDPASRGAPAP